MAAKIWRHETHMVKQNITLEQFIEKIQEEDGDVQNIKTLQTTTKGSNKRNTSSEQFMNNRETLSNSTTSATIVVVIFEPYPPRLNMPPLTDEQVQRALDDMGKIGFTPSSTALLQQ